MSSESREPHASLSLAINVVTCCFANTTVRQYYACAYNGEKKIK